MAAMAQNLNAAFLSASKTVKTSSGSAINIVICLVTVGSEQLFSFAVFNCPCPPTNVSNQGDREVVSGNAIYGCVFIIVPAITLFFMGYAMNIRTWKLMTGCCNRHSEAARGLLAGCATLSEIFMQSMVAPCAWVSIAFLDGKYYACAMTRQPYDMTCRDVIRTPANKIRFTVEYERQKQVSQVIGWCFIASVLIVGALVYMFYRWFSPLTYHQRHYMKWYQEIEVKQFEELAKKEITEETKENVLNFLQHRREKTHWDKISTVFTHTKFKGYEVYSRLDQWSENQNTSCMDEARPLDRQQGSSRSTDKEGNDVIGVDVVEMSEKTALETHIDETARLLNSSSMQDTQC
uniref:Protein FAM26F-like n=1 Tax=Phallusia mammillata TaxID=59560 RepID=A0A6F9DBW8_9ASCI|nr:protein FAM26F-like [Phallusia mammillata]